MSVYVKINDNQYDASITGRMHDSDWNNRESKAIRLTMSYAEASNLFVDDVKWSIVQDVEDFIEQINEETGEVSHKVVIKQEVYDNSDYSVAGDIIDHRDGTVTVKMGKPTAEELLAMLEEVML